MTPRQSDPAVDIAAGAQVPAPRPSSDPVDGSPDERTPARLGPVARARVRESATRNATAAGLFAAGRYQDAVPLFEQALTSCRSTLGGDHPTTLTVAGNLGVTYVAAGQRRKGVRMIAANAATRARVLGDTHPATLTARDALATAHRLRGDADAAVSLATQVVTQRSRTLGPTHVDTLSSRMGLALALSAAGDRTSARSLLASTMADAEDTLGGGHEHTLALVECGRAHGLLRRRG